MVNQLLSILQKTVSITRPVFESESKGQASKVSPFLTVNNEETNYCSFGVSSTTRNDEELQTSQSDKDGGFL